ncbi:DegT/DnrJ/EryC1/StrS family aminotransferase [Paraburkholderia sp. J10-1]|uniref:DegT/DnrJ/EryC1/StrS family aminotransferase n=1 Tax=Paraburkholderia sp. J10-1 TaxID=2805430 RepID=UPI002AB6D0EC|nr:DegT/DnrJ/EryC1/StrS family aminotransferase [Paraburkholderia sp. J10-1]
MMIPFFDFSEVHRELGSRLTATFESVMSRGHLIMGQELEVFEDEFAKYCGAKYCVGVGNGLDALALALKARGIGSGDEVLVPSQTFIATWLAVSMVGATPIPVEIDPATYSIDPEKIAEKLSSRTAAIIPVHLYGLPANMGAIRQLADTNGLFVLEDAAQSHGAMFENKRCGSLGDAAAFSFYPTKNLGAMGDGGAVVTDDKSIAEKVRMLRNYGSRVKYVHEVVGGNTRLDELQAALLRQKLPLLDGWNAKRGAIAKRYSEGLATLDEIVLPTVPADRTHVFHLYVIRSKKRDALARSLQEQGIGSAVHYPIPPHLHGAFSDSGFAKGSLPIAETVALESLSLPMWPQMPLEFVDAVVDHIKQFYAKA